MEKKVLGLSTVAEIPETLSKKQREQLHRDALYSTRLLERDTYGKEKVIRLLPTNGPTLVVGLFDMHLGALSGDIEEMDRIRNFILDDPRIICVFGGDNIEGFKEGYTSTNRSPFNVNQQLDILEDDFVSPLAGAGKVAAAVEGEFGHAGWAEERSLILLNPMMFKRHKIPIIRQGGILILQSPDGRQSGIRIHHNTEGNSKYEATYGLREEMFEEPEAERLKTHWAGHSHFAGVAEEWHALNNLPFCLVKSGTPKGSNPDVPPDRFGIKLGGRRRPNPLGQGIVLYGQHERIYGRPKEPNAYPFMDLSTGGLVLGAMDLLENIDRQGNFRNELLARIHSLPPGGVEKGPRIYTNPKKYLEVHGRFEEIPGSDGPVEGYGTTVEDENHIDGGRDHVSEGGQPIYESFASQYSRISYTLLTRLPVIIHMLGNVRHGSSFGGIDKLEVYIDRHISNEPNAFAFLLRAMIDKKLSGDPERFEKLEELKNVLAPVSKQLLLLLLDGNLKDSRWGRVIKVPKDEGGNIPAFPPATYLSNETSEHPTIWP